MEARSTVFAPLTTNHRGRNTRRVTRLVPNTYSLRKIAVAFCSVSSLLAKQKRSTLSSRLSA